MFFLFRFKLDLPHQFNLDTLPPMIMEVENGVPPILVSFHLVGNFPLKHDYGRKGKSKFEQMIFWKKNTHTHTHTPSATNSLRLSIYFATRRQWQFLMCYKEVGHYLTQNESEKPCGSKRKNLYKHMEKPSKNLVYSTNSHLIDPF